MPDDKRNKAPIKVDVSVGLPEALGSPEVQRQESHADVGCLCACGTQSGSGSGTGQAETP